MAHYGMPRHNLRRQLSGLERTKWGVSGTSTQANCTSVVGGVGGEAVVGWDASGAADAVQGLGPAKGHMRIGKHNHGSAWSMLACGCVDAADTLLSESTACTSNLNFKKALTIYHDYQCMHLINFEIEIN